MAHADYPSVHMMPEHATLQFSCASPGPCDEDADWLLKEELGMLEGLLKSKYPSLDWNDGWNVDMWTATNSLRNELIFRQCGRLPPSPSRTRSGRAECRKNQHVLFRLDEDVIPRPIKPAAEADMPYIPDVVLLRTTALSCGDNLSHHACKAQASTNRASQKHLDMAASSKGEHGPKLGRKPTFMSAESLRQKHSEADMGEKANMPDITADDLNCLPSCSG